MGKERGVKDAYEPENHQTIWFSGFLVFLLSDYCPLVDNKY
jgi:hypothetical protein